MLKEFKTWLLHDPTCFFKKESLCALWMEEGRLEAVRSVLQQFRQEVVVAWIALWQWKRVVIMHLCKIYFNVYLKKHHI